MTELPTKCETSINHPADEFNLLYPCRIRKTEGKRRE